VPAPYPRALRSRIATLNRLPVYRPRDLLVRDIVEQRAAHAREYCLMPTHPESIFEVEHIVPKARWRDYVQGVPNTNSGATGGAYYPARRPRERLAAETYDHLSNFAWSCFFCNSAKGGRSRAGQLRLFDPRYDHWPHHFNFSTDPGCQGVILPKTDIGFETIRAMGFHQGGPRGALVARYSAILLGLYPPPVLRLAYNL